MPALLGHGRKHLRAPINSTIIYVKGGQVLKGNLVNISEGGLLARHFPSMEVDEMVDAMVEIPEYPTFQNQSRAEIKNLSVEAIQKKIFRIKLKAARKLVDPTSSGPIPQNFVGMYFINLAQDAQIFVSAYVKSFSQNIIFLLKLLENQKDLELEDIRHMANLLNYPADLKISLLRQKILHDYQSLQWN